jgi:RNA polymerase sigma factor (sigma-70 family)
MRKTEITIEMYRTVTIRHISGNARSPHPECTDRADMVSPAEAVEAAQPDLRTEQAGRRAGVRARRPRSKPPMMTGETLDALLAYLDADREQAGQKYELIRRRLVKFFECRGCAYPEEYADATIDRVAVKIAADVSIYTNDPSMYFYGVAWNMLKDYWRRSKKQPISIEVLEEPAYGSDRLTSAPDYETDQRTEQQLEYLDQCLQVLQPECRELIKQYYEAPPGANIDNRKLLAARLGIPLNALRVRVHRIRARLRQSVSEFLYEGGQ